MAGDFILGGSENEFDLGDPNNQVPPPPHSSTVAQLNTQLKAFKSILADIKKGFGKTEKKYATRQAFEAAKVKALQEINEGIPNRIGQRKEWEDRYSIKRSQVGKDTVLMSADEVYNSQQTYDQASDQNNPYVAAYKNAITGVETLKKAIETKGSPEHGLSPSNQQLALAAAWKAVEETITPEVLRLRNTNVPRVIDKYGREIKGSGFALTEQIPKLIKTATDKAIELADSETSTSAVETTDKYGRPETYISTRTPEQTAEFDRIVNRATALNGVTAAEAKQLADPNSTASTAAATPISGNIAKDTPPADKTPISAKATNAYSTRMEGLAATFKPEPPARGTAPTGGGAGNPNQVLRSAVDEALKNQGLTDTPANRKKMRDEIKTKGVIDNTAWEAKFKADYPQYAFMFTTEMKGKYPDLFQLFQKASADPLYDKDLFARQFDGSSWATELKGSQKGRQLTAAVGTFKWGSGNLAKFLMTATQMSWEGDMLKAEAYKELFRKGTDKKYVNDLAIKEVQASSPYLKLKKIGTSFFSPMQDKDIEDALTGETSPDDVLRLARLRAGVMYPHLKEAIDAGLTLDDIAYDYKRIAAQTLELSPDAVDMSSAKFSRAMKVTDGKAERMMSTGEWEQTLRTDPQYRYSFTKQANSDATDLGLSLARAFGKTG